MGRFGADLTFLRPFSASRLCFLPELRQLRLEQNALATLPVDIGLLGLLSELDISNNLITRLPDSIGRLTQLRKLNCSANLLAELPTTVELLQSLEELEARPPGLALSSTICLPRAYCVGCA